MIFQEKKIKKEINLLELISLQIKKYFDKKLYIGDLIQDLEGLLNQLTIVEEEWKKDFRTLWLDIEVAYSLALDQELENLTDEGNIITESSLYLLKKMVEDKINELKTVL
ncbi:hypothetical protein [Candidatus Rhabdochlamydia sp. T3358]|uniref:hypothetical protein n=1 Tax=Candidatus Rhabdochlamydia sp. T3358 TaxID=2099795 RepID=UPI0010B08B99|nr:hypothetical protein [Candidatus Rhabdochlamydia sp. T3358]VHO01008.1 hypothetical protein RHT_00275 [Candidatus Rhabdochlamydia sp. T3358]